MSTDNTNCDVQVKMYDGSKHLLAHITFFNDCEALFNGDRIRLDRDGNRLFFNEDPTGVKFSGKGKDKNRLQLWADVRKVQDLEGEYDLKFDGEKSIYYIDKTEMLSDCKYQASMKGTKQLNHNPGNREKGVQRMSPVTIKENGKKLVENQKLAEEKIAKDRVVSALMALLRTQIKGNMEALATLTTLDAYLR